MNFKVTMPGDEDNVHGRNTARPLVTLERVVSWIRSLELDEYTTDGLIKTAENYPHGALSLFRKNFDTMLARVRQKRSQEEEIAAQEMRKEEEAEKKNKNELVEKVEEQSSSEVTEVAEPDVEIEEIKEKQKRKSRRKPISQEEVDKNRKESEDGKESSE
jgi:hypothetical protein